MGSGKACGSERPDARPATNARGVGAIRCCTFCGRDTKNKCGICGRCFGESRVERNDDDVTDKSLGPPPEETFREGV